MHKFILKTFEAIKNLCSFLKIVGILCIMMLLLFWIQNLIGAEWKWMGFISPFLTSLVEFANYICSFSFDLFGTKVELKYISALVILVGVCFLMNFFIMLAAMFEAAYKSTHFVCKKTQEFVMNKGLQNAVKKEEKQIKEYTVHIHTAIKEKYNNLENKINLEEQNQIMNKYLIEKLSVDPRPYNNGFTYHFSNIENIDSVLNVLFKILNSKAPIKYTICIQAGDNLKQLDKLISLKEYGKIIIAADTLYRYQYNDIKLHETSQVGVFQYENRTLEVHEYINQEV